MYVRESWGVRGGSKEVIFGQRPGREGGHHGNVWRRACQGGNGRRPVWPQPVWLKGAEAGGEEVRRELGPECRGSVSCTDLGLQV